MRGSDRAPYWRDVGTIDAYYEANMDLCAVAPQFNLYDEDWPIYTLWHNDPPAKTVFDEPGGRRAPRVRDRALERLGELGIACPHRIVAQIGQICAERPEPTDRVLDLAPDGRAIAGRPSAELDLEIGVDDLLAGPHGLAAPKALLDDVDELAVEITVVDRGNERKCRDEHRKVGDDDGADSGFVVGHYQASTLRNPLTPPSSPDFRSAS